MKVLAIVGSFRKEGNTDIIIDKILEGAQSVGAETEKIFVDDLQIASCQGCMECRKEGICKQDDDMMKLVKKIDQAHGVIVGTPIYGNYMTGQLKVLLDRMMGVINKVTYLPGEGRKSITRLEPKKRNIIILATAGAPEPECAEDAFKLIRRMFSSFANGGRVTEMVATGINEKGQVVFSKEELLSIAKRQGVPNPEEVAQQAWERNQQVLAKAYEEGKQLII